MKLVVSPVATGDVEAVSALAHLVWQQTYPGIITQAQIDYMLAQRYEPQRLRQELSLPTVWWDQACIDHQLVGFASCLLVGEDREMKLDKLYVHPEQQRRGIGSRLLHEVIAHAVAAACASVILAVNKHNARAIAAYRKHGFAIRESVCVDIGGGFVMDDFIMAKSL